MPKIQRTYPQPDSPAANMGPRERALAVYKYLMDLEPEAAVKHPLFDVIVHAFTQAGTAATRKWATETVIFVPYGEFDEQNSSPAEEAGGEASLPKMAPSLIEMLRGERTI